jgi:thiol peroxidase
MAERVGVVKSKGNPLTLIGNELKIGAPAPDFEVLDNNLRPVHLSLFRGKTVVIISVLSIETSVCDTETRRFNKEAEKLGGDVVILVISMDLPFSQSRWCGAAGVKNVTMLSDHKDASFGHAFGVLIKESRLLARTVSIIDREGKVRYIQYVAETGSEPDYDDVMKALKKVL